MQAETLAVEVTISLISYLEPEKEGAPRAYSFARRVLSSSL